MLDRSLTGLRTLIDRSLTEVRVSAGVPAEKRLFPVADFIAEIRSSAALEASTRKCELIVADVPADLAVDADPDLLASALANLLQNAFKFTCRDAPVKLTTHGSADRVLIEVEDRCGGLPPGFAEKMFLPFTQAGDDRSGLGLGLSISRRSVEANHGVLSVRDIPGSGCVFTIDLPRHALPSHVEERSVNNRSEDFRKLHPVAERT